MRKLLLIAVLFLLVNTAHAQYYISVMPALTSSPGSIDKKGNLSFEVGKQWDCFSIGLDAGENNFTINPVKDNSIYFEIRPNLNIFQQGKFTNTITTGIGFVPNGQSTTTDPKGNIISTTESLLLMELTSGIEYAYSETIHINIMVGQFNYSGKNIASISSQPFFGVSIVRYFKAYKPISIIEHK